jgi:hypothetical protein
LAAWLMGLNHGTVLIIVCDRPRAERVQTRQTHPAEQKEKHQARSKQALLRLITGDYSPFR